LTSIGSMTISSRLCLRSIRMVNAISPLACHIFVVRVDGPLLLGPL
jgi:hypothetical protein